jgi:hypothetical protein
MRGRTVDGRRHGAVADGRRVQGPSESSRGEWIRS